MRDYKARVDLEFVDKLVQVANENNIAVEEYEGCLLDNYIFYDTDTISVGNVQPRKFILVGEKYLNPNSSCMEMTMTDNEELVEEFYSRFEE